MYTAISTLSGPTNSVYQGKPPSPRVYKTEGYYAGFDKTCTAKQTVVFIKTHKTGSQTLARTIERYGCRHNLTFVRKINDKKSIHFANLRFNSKSVHGFLPPPNVTKGDYSNYKYNMLTLHVRYTRKYIEEFMEDGAKYTTLLRDPSTQLESAFSFFNIERLMKNTKSSVSKIEQFLLTPQKYPKAASHVYVNNDQIFDLGLDNNFFNNETAINETISNLDEEMDLVLINEFFDESLLLLRKLLCWKLEDILYLPMNRRADYKKTPLSSALRQKAREKNHADTLLYDHFVKRLHERIRDYGPSFHVDLMRYRDMMADVRKKCVIGQYVSGKQILYNQTENMSKECRIYTEASPESNKRIRQLMKAPTVNYK
ncbi:galactosylceramide sulfotransferase-like isoform X2 [Antedon mediterranea]